ncbi:MAG: M57 family metalloprotease [Meiothermus sp.]|nr:M57 family metalloprotease [Meiothermus sp.]
MSKSQVQANSKFGEGKFGQLGRIGRAGIGVLLAASLAACGSQMGHPGEAEAANTLRGEPATGQVQSQLITEKGVGLWTSQGNTVPVCWETAEYNREKGLVQAAVEGSWQFWAKIRFSGWGDCPTSGSAKHVRVRISPQGTENLGAGGSAVVGTAALSTAAEGARVNLSFNPDGSADRGRVEYIAVHEFGHVLGFGHEQDHADNKGNCTDSVDSSASPVPFTAYDRDSVMNYCNSDGNSTGRLTDLDIAGVQQAYGVRRANRPPVNACVSSPLRPMASLAAAWNDGGLASFAVYPSTGSAFAYHQQRLVRNGGWSDSVKWASGDFDGDGRSDIGAVWNNSGNNTLTVRLARGSTFAQAHWLLNGGGWMASTAWLPGDFDGDGRTDLAGIWNDGGLVSIAVYLSTGSGFRPPVQWSRRDGGWGDSVKWVPGDFDGDGRTDIAAAWNNNGRTTLTVRRSAGSSFTHTHWRVDANYWFSASSFLAGDFDGDGQADLAEVWNDLGLNSINVYLSLKTSFAPRMAWATRDGGIPADVKWIPADFNGDGRTDIAAVWEYFGGNVLTVRASSGSRFSAAHWSTNAGGWMASTAWCAGRF